MIKTIKILVFTEIDDEKFLDDNVAGVPRRETVRRRGEMLAILAQQAA